MQVFYRGANASGQGLILDGMTATGWTNPAVGAEFSSNPSHFAAANLCIDATTATSGLQLQFDLKQLYGESNNATNFRVTVNGTQIGSIYQPNIVDREWQTIVIDLSAYAGQKINIGTESNCKYSFSAFPANANYIDSAKISNKIFTLLYVKIKHNLLHLRQ